MKANKVVINVLLVIIMILVVVACVVAYMCFTNDVEIIAPQQEEAIFSVENYPRIDGSISTLPLAEAFKANFTKTNINEIEVIHSKTHNAYENLINGNADLILVSELAEEGIELEVFPIVKEAFVFFVNKDNPVENLTLSQIQDIYSGKTKNWNEVGGNNNKIVAFQRPENSESQNGILKLVMQGKKIKEPTTETISQSIDDIIDVISDYENKETAIGYSYYYYAKTMYTSTQIKLLAVNGIEPTYENIQTGLYDLQTTYYAVIRKNEPENSNTRKLLNAMMSERGQSVAKEAGYVQNY